MVFNDNFFLFFQLHDVFRTQQGRQREPSVKTLPFPTFCRIQEALRVEWQNSTPRFATHSRVGRGNLLLRHSVPHFLPNSGGIAC